MYVCLVKVMQQTSHNDIILWRLQHTTHSCYNDLFSCRMTKFDIRNYFQNIYGVNVAKVHTRIQLGMPV